MVTITRNLKPSARGELEITDVNVEYLRRKQLRVHRLSRGFAWLDAGTSSSLHEASAYVQTIEKRAGIKIGCPEEAAFRRGFLSLEQLEALTAKMPKCEYREYLTEVVAEAKRLAQLDLPMNVLTCDIPGLLIIEPKVFGDARGFFLETWNLRRYREAGLDADFVQDNLSFSRRGILRGLHFQSPKPQGKLLQVLQGEVFDVAVDIRRSSPTFGKWHGLMLSGENKRQFYVPPGFAHGFAVLSETALFHYKCTEFYSPKDELAIRWDDPDIGIQWPLKEPLLSERDAKGLRLRDAPPGAAVCLSCQPWNCLAFCSSERSARSAGNCAARWRRWPRSPAWTFPEIDLTSGDSIRQWVRDTRPNIVINAAAYTAVDKAESEPDKAMKINGVAPGILAEEAKKLGALLVHYSTDYVFDGAKTEPYVETDAPNPLGAYGRTKLAGDEAVRAVGGAHLIFRLCWVYGARGQNFMLTMMRLAREREKLRVVGDQVGCPTWSRMIAETTALALKQAMAARDPGAFTGTYHLAVVGRHQLAWLCGCHHQPDAGGGKEMRASRGHHDRGVSDAHKAPGLLGAGVRQARSASLACGCHLGGEPEAGVGIVLNL